MPEAKKEVKSLVSLVSEKQHTKHDCMPFFNLLVLNKDLWGRTRVRRKGRAAPFLFSFCCVLPTVHSKLNHEPWSAWHVIPPILGHVPDEEKQSNDWHLW